jgi:hypothetical protein
MIITLLTKQQEAEIMSKLPQNIKNNLDGLFGFSPDFLAPHLAKLSIQPHSVKTKDGYVFVSLVNEKSAKDIKVMENIKGFMAKAYKDGFPCWCFELPK